MADRQPRRGHRTVPHTADVRIEAWGATREECIAEAVLGMVESFADMSGSEPTTDREDTVTGTSDEELLTALLDEVIYRLDTEGEIPVAVQVRLAPEGLHARFTMTDVGSVQSVGAVPKAVSLHELAVTRGPEGWSCSVTVDV
jgi:SHS2 domain-containing protein